MLNIPSKIFIFLLLKILSNKIFIFITRLKEMDAASVFLKQINQQINNLKLVIYIAYA